MPFPVDNIRLAAKERGLTLAQLEKALSFGNGVIAKWEKNKGAPPIDRVVAIAEYLQVPVSELTGDDSLIIKEPTQASGPNRQAFYAALENMDHDQLLEALQAVTDKLREKQK